MDLICRAIKFEQHKHVQSCTSSKEIQDYLCQLHVTQRQDTNIHYYFQKLYLKKQNEHTSMSNHIRSFLNLKYHIVEAGHKLEDILVIYTILYSLLHSNIWDIVKYNLLNKRKSLILDILTTELISVHKYSECDCLANKNNKKVKSKQMVLLAKSGLSFNLFRRKPRKKKLNNKSKKPSPHPTGTRYYIYSKRGHWTSEYCSKTNRRDDFYYPKGSANLVIKHFQSLEKYEISQMLIVLSDSILSIGIFLNCSTTFYMFTSCNYFIKYTKSLEEFITVGGYNCISVTGQGFVCFLVLLPKGYLNITLHNILHILHLGISLISLSALYCQKVFVKSLDNNLVLLKNGKKLFRTSLTGSTGTLYHIQCISLASNTAYLTKIPDSICLQYHCMEYLSSYTISSMCYQNLVKGLNTNTSQDFNHLCSRCANEKLYCFLFPKSSNNQYSKIELVVMNLTGSMFVPTQNRFLYALTIVEVSYCYPVERLLHTKKDTCHDLAKWLSYYLYFFSFLFLFSFHLDLLHKEGVWKIVI